MGNFLHAKMSKKYDARSRQKVKHRKDRDEDQDVPQELIDEAAELGCEVWQLEEVKAKLAEEKEDSSLDEVDEKENEDEEEESKDDKK